VLVRHRPLDDLGSSGAPPLEGGGGVCHFFVQDVQYAIRSYPPYAKLWLCALKLIEIYFLACGRARYDLQPSGVQSPPKLKGVHKKIWRE
jgi:hypothetical protein